MNVTRRNNGLAITGSNNEIIALLASLEYGLYAQAGVESKIRGENAKAATAQYMARHREAKRLRLLAESLQTENEMPSTDWQEVTIKVDRPNLPKPTLMKYLMTGEELALFRTDLENYAHSADAAQFGNYAFVDGSSFTPGTTALAFTGMEIMGNPPHTGLYTACDLLNLTDGC